MQAPGPGDLRLAEVNTLYGSPISNNSAKVRSYLTFKRILFQEVVASNRVYDTILAPATGRRGLPILRTSEGELLQGAMEIIDALEARHPSPSARPATPRQRLTALLLEAYAHDWARIPAMYYRWAYSTQNQDHLMRELGRTCEPNARTDDLFAIGYQNCSWILEQLPLLGITARTRSAIEAWTHDLFGWLDEHFARHDYLLGARPSIADFTFMGPLYGHLYHDPYAFALMRGTAPHVVRWVERMSAEPAAAGDWLPDDQVPDTLYPLLAHTGAEYLPAALDTVHRVSDWVARRPGEPIPRVLGQHDVSVGGVTETQAVWTSSHSVVRRPLVAYQSAAGAARGAMDRLLEEIGGDIDLSIPIPHALTRRNHQLWAT